MKFLKASECLSFLGGTDDLSIKDLAIIEGKKYSDESFITVYNKPVSIFYFTNSVLEWMGPYDQALVYVTEIGVWWPFGENRYLYERLRMSYGSVETVNESPGHLFECEERMDLKAFLQLFVLFGWGFHLIQRPSNFQCFFSHDEWMNIKTKSPDIIRNDPVAMECKLREGGFFNNGLAE
jgi:hypothetical protein